MRTGGKYSMSIISDTARENSNFLEAALAYATRFNLPVFPLVPGTKRPLTSNGLYDASTDTEQINQWWSKNPEANIGLPMGRESGIVAIDLDPRNGSEASIDQLEHNDHEPLPDTVTVLTPTGGEHRYYRWDERITASKLENYPGIDLQGQGRYVVAPGSIHPNGGKYEFELSSHISDTPTATLPEWFIQIAEKPSSNGEIKARSDDYWMNILEGIDDGGRNNAAASLIGHLLRKNVAVPVVYELIQAWNDRNAPPIEADELIKTFNSVLKLEVERVKRRNR